MKADNDTRSAWSEFVNTGKGNLTQAIRDPEVRLLALEAWNAVSMGPAPARTRPAADDDLDGNKKRKLDDNGSSRQDNGQWLASGSLQRVRFATLAKSLPDKLSQDKWDKERNGQELCCRFQVKACTRGDACKFLHHCAMPSCVGLKHPAMSCRKNM